MLIGLANTRCASRPVLEGRRGVWSLDQVRVYDAGPDADASTTDDYELFAVQGVFVP